jgi:hypothetical protein
LSPPLSKKSEFIDRNIAFKQNNSYPPILRRNNKRYGVSELLNE